MTDLLERIAGRRSIRSFTDREIEGDRIRKLIEAAIYAPSGGNIQAWNVVVLQGAGNIERIKAASPGLLGNPSALIIFCADKRRAYELGGELGRDTLSIMDIAIAAQNICLEATDLGLGSCMIRSFNQNAVRELLELPEAMSPELIISLGYPLDIPEPPPRRSVEDTIYYWDKVKSR